MQLPLRKESGMAFYHFHIAIGSRGSADSRKSNSVKGAAYISGTKMHDGRTGQTFDFHTKEVVFAPKEMLLPDAVAKKHPAWKSPEIFWNEVERNERAVNAQLYRSMDIALPKELNREQQLNLAAEMAEYFRLKGMAVYYGVHDEKGKTNPHVHIMTACRGFTEDGEWAKKEQKVYALDQDGNKIPIIDPKTGRQKTQIRKRKRKDGTVCTSETKIWKRETVASNFWNKKESLEEWRAAWEKLANAALESAGKAERIDHRSYAAQGIDRLPTIHEGAKARKLDEAGAKRTKKEFVFSNIVISGFQKVESLLTRVRPAFRSGALREQLDRLLKKCRDEIKKVGTGSAGRRQYNTMVRARNQAADLIDSQIQELQDELDEMQTQHIQDEKREEEIIDRLEKLKSEREAHVTARRDAERHRKSESDAEEEGRRSREASDAAERKYQTEEKNRAEHEEHHRRRR